MSSYLAKTCHDDQKAESVSFRQDDNHHTPEFLLVTQHFTHHHQFCNTKKCFTSDSNCLIYHYIATFYRKCNQRLSHISLNISSFRAWCQSYRVFAQCCNETLAGCQRTNMTWQYNLVFL